jgi:5-oxoprolinase (ATP-hydrolysing)
MALRVGIDTGGTFTDVVLVDDVSGEIKTIKVESTPSDPGLAVLKGLRELGKPPESIASIVLGTTISTNAVIQRKGARVLYITTKGFEDIPYLQRADKPDPYDLQWERPRPLVKRRDCIGVAERVASDGSIVQPLDRAELDRVEKLVSAWIAEGVTDESEVAKVKSGGNHAVAINLLFAYANPGHEEALAANLAKKHPGLAISRSSEVSPLWREYERASTTILDAYTRPMLTRFLQNLQSRLLAEGYRARLAVMKSNGGRTLAGAAANRPVQILLSGLAGGVIAGGTIGNAVGRRSVITFDMGGTSTDVGVIVDGVLTYTTEYQLEFGLPVSIPSLDVVTIGAGGGSIAWVDKGGLLKVGPHSAGADPGPACYGRGGTAPTVTDANLVLGRLGSRSLLGGEMELDEKASWAALETLGAKLGLTAERAARAVIAVANESMANSIRVLTIQRGLDPSEFALVAFGGAGPLHASEIAAILNILDVVIPPNPGLTSALGTLLAVPRVDIQRTYVRRGSGIESGEIKSVLLDLRNGAKAELKAEGHDEEPEVRSTVSMRYAGQSHEQEVPVVVPLDDPNLIATLFDEFHRQHEKSYGYCFESETIEITACSSAVSGEGVVLPKAKGTNAGQVAKAAARRTIDLGGPHDKSDCPVLSRAALRDGQEILGPAVVEGYDSVVFVPPRFKAVVDVSGTITMHGEQATRHSRTAADPETLSIINNAFVNICREMGTTMVRTAYSPIFNESRDFSCAIFDPTGQMLAQGEYCPAQLGAIVCTVEALLRELGSKRIAAGDVIIHNDPYRGGCHMPEHLLIKPIYYGGALMGYAAIVAHFAEIGGMVVGSFAATATEVFQEGLRLPPVRLIRNGERVQEVWDIMLANHRTPRNTWGDLHAMLAALKVAEDRFVALCDKFGSQFILDVSASLLNYAERWMRSEIKAIPDGVYEFEDFMEDDGVGDQKIRMHVKVTVASDQFTADFSQSAPQVNGPINATLGVTTSATFNALYQLADKGIPKNAGCYRPVRVITKRGTCLDVEYPAPSVGGNTETQPKIVFMILGALAKAIPDRISACEGCTSCNFLIGGVHPKSGEYYAHYHFEASGWGGRATKDGNDCQNHIHGNCRITPVEVFESRFPIRVLSYGLRTDSGGAGKFRGGLASYRTMRVEAPELRVSMLMDHTKSGPWPFDGGMTGSPARISIRKSGEKTFRSFSEAFGTASASKFADIRLHKGDQVRIESCGGAGYGDPRERERALVERDLAEGYISSQAASRLYGARSARSGPAKKAARREPQRMPAKRR